MFEARNEVITFVVLCLSDLFGFYGLIYWARHHICGAMSSRLPASRFQSIIKSAKFGSGSLPASPKNDAVLAQQPNRRKMLLPDAEQVWVFLMDGTPQVC